MHYFSIDIDFAPDNKKCSCGGKNSYFSWKIRSMLDTQCYCIAYMDYENISSYI